MFGSVYSLVTWFSGVLRPHLMQIVHRKRLLVRSFGGWCSCFPASQPPALIPHCGLGHRCLHLGYSWQTQHQNIDLVFFPEMKQTFFFHNWLTGRLGSFSRKCCSMLNYSAVEKVFSYTFQIIKHILYLTKNNLSKMQLRGKGYPNLPDPFMKNSLCP